MKPYYEQDGIAIYHGNSREIVPHLSGAPDLVLTDPPYSSGGFTRSDRNSQPSAKYVITGAASIEKILATSAQWQKPLLIAGMVATIARAFIP